jgi:hypothetical protein
MYANEMPYMFVFYPVPIVSKKYTHKTSLIILSHLTSQIDIMHYIYNI